MTRRTSKRLCYCLWWFGASNIGEGQLLLSATATCMPVIRRSKVVEQCKRIQGSAHSIFTSVAAQLHRSVCSQESDADTVTRLKGVTANSFRLQLRLCHIFPAKEYQIKSTVSLVPHLLFWSSFPGKKVSEVELRSDQIGSKASD